MRSSLLYVYKYRRTCSLRPFLLPIFKMPGLVNSTPSGSGLPLSVAEPSTESTDTTHFGQLAKAVATKLYSKGHLDVRVERMETNIPYPTFLSSTAWTPVVASLRGSVLKFVPDHDKGHPEHLVIVGSVSSILPQVLSRYSHSSSCRVSSYTSSKKNPLRRPFA